MSSLAKLLWDAVRSDPDEKIQQAQKTLARCISEEHYNREMCVFYDRRMINIDAHRSAANAFRFAEAFASFEEHFAEAQRWSERADEARAKLNAMIGAE